MAITRTLNPLPFRDLEPHRFEDLIRQLIYDFRSWKRLEATGRTGSDHGFDVRGIELAEADSELPQEDDEPTEQSEGAEVSGERVWLVQCKREKSITPKKLLAYLDEIPAIERPSLYGLIFAACCDFSKASRDIVARWCLENQLQEFQVWGAGDIESLLLQPKNDHVLFAFFGISLQIRRRTVASRLRSTIAMKRKIERVLRPRLHSPLLFRDPEDENFPYVAQGARPESFRWKMRTFRGHDYRGIKFLHKECRAYIGSDQTWDVANAVNEAIPHASENDWYDFEVSGQLRALEQEARTFWANLAPENKGLITVEGYVPIEKIKQLTTSETYWMTPIIHPQLSLCCLRTIISQSAIQA